jgi:hypothetical protein
MTDKTRWERYLENNQDQQRTVKPWDFLNPNTQYASEELFKERFDMCKACPELIDLTKTCKKCGCFMAAKTKLLGATCPLGKW